MIWGAFSAGGKSQLALIDNKIDSQIYQKVLSDYLRPVFKQSHTFQHDNAPAHASKSTKEWLAANGIATLEWPSVSPDMNPIENIWGIMCRNVYKDGKSYANVSELRKAILAAWNAISMEQLQALSDSMESRVFSCIRSGGKAIKY